MEEKNVLDSTFAHVKKQCVKSMGKCEDCSFGILDKSGAPACSIKELVTSPVSFATDGNLTFRAPRYWKD